METERRIIKITNVTSELISLNIDGIVDAIPTGGFSVHDYESFNKAIDIKITGINDTIILPI